MVRAASAQTPSRNGAIDLGRYFGACGIVLFHMKAPGGSVGYAALPLFTFLSIWFAVQNAGERSWREEASRRASRLLLPFAVWSLIYLVLKLGEVALTGAQVSEEFWPYMLLTGPALHLWFLPFLFVASLGVLACLPDPAQWPRLAPWLAIGGALSTGLVLWTIEAVTIPWPFAQYLFVVPAVLLGTAVAVSVRAGDPVALVILAGMSLLVLYLVEIWSWEIAQAQTVIGVGIACVLLMLPLPGTAVTRTLGTISMGVYLMHPMISSICIRVLPQTPFSTATSSLIFALVIILICTGVSLLLLRSARWSRALGLGA